jgi:tetratricopeptide (TPR) repeat protein
MHNVARLAIILMLSALVLPAHAQVRLWEEPLVLPTYGVGAPDPNPIFYTGRVYQGAKGPIYPYPLMDKLTDIRADKSYNAVYLENRYLKLSVLPEIGGRIFTAVDKTNQYDFFYRQHVIKPALIGMLGAWISGGVEWNIPHHHRATSFMPVDYTTTENADGSRTIWVGETELRHRMRWIIGLTLHPDRSYIETTVRLFNRTPVAHSGLYWANPAVHANPDYQVLFPPGTEFATFHAKNQFTRWPFSDSVFNNTDYTRGVDLSWWKNHPSPTSFFAWNYEDDFHAGYDHGNKAGVVSVADHHIMPGKKLWEWGNGPQGRMWDRILTETDGPYIELMVGGFSDNQPDYSWWQPYESRSVTHYWYPIRELAGVKSATREAAVNLDVGSDRTARFGFNTTSEHNSARALLASGERILFDQRIHIAPDRPFVHALTLPANLPGESLRVSLQTSAGVELVSYAPVGKTRSPVPEPFRPPLPPKEIKTNEELYLTGLRLEQFYNPHSEPYPYYEEALKRDPGDYRVNTALGILYCKRGMFQEAEEKLRTAIRRITLNHTAPRDGEAFYYLGVALRARHKDDEAFGAFSKAAWSHAWKAAGNYALAELACRKRDYGAALQYLQNSLASNGENSKALNLRCAVLRKLGRGEEAGVLAAKTVAADPLDFYAWNELRLTGKDRRNFDELSRRMRSDDQSHLELASNYADAALWDEAIEVLARRMEGRAESGRVDPMIAYHLGYYWEQKGDPARGAAYYREAGALPPEYCFPFRLESIDVLRRAIAANPSDARAPYYLGNLLYDFQPGSAIAQWEKSRSLDPALAQVHRNLGFAYAWHSNDTARAMTSLEQAIARNPSDPRYFIELDQVCEAAGVPANKRLALLEKHQATVEQRDDALAREIELLIRVGRHDQALELLRKHHFHLWEGARGVHELYVDALLQRGRTHSQGGRHREALADYEAALEFPENLEVAPRAGQQFPRIQYLVGEELAALGRMAEARTAFEKAAAPKPDWSEDSYFQALALAKLEQKEKAAELYAGLLESAQQRLAGLSGTPPAAFAARQTWRSRKAQLHYLVGLALLGQAKRELARAEFKAALSIDPYHTNAGNQLSQLNP